MKLRSLRRAVLCALALWLASLSAEPGAAARVVVDSAGRRVDVPDRIERVMAAGPPASIALYTLAPDKLVGWVRALRPEEIPFIAPAYVDLPAHGRLTGRGSTANVETVLSLRPDVIVDIGSLEATYVSLADRVQEQTGIPYLLIDGRLGETAETYRLLGRILGAESRAERLAAYAERVLGELKTGLAKIPQAERPRVYYGRGPEGLETSLAGSINVEVLELVGARNVAAAAGSGGLTTVSPEQVLSWNPEVILTMDRTFFDSVRRDPLWASLAAVQDGRVYLAPSLPWGWFDSPPGVNRLIGVQWLMAILYPGRFPGDLREAARAFYRLFYHIELAEPLLDELLGGAVTP